MLIKSFSNRGVGNGTKLSFVQDNISDFLFDDKKDLSSYDDISVEIGFGDGQYLINLALQNPSTLYIGCEAYTSGIANLIRQITEGEIKNIRIYHGDARVFLNDSIKDNALSNVHIICPDPWPKKRHNKRRLINDKFLSLLSRKLQPKGMTLIATDHDQYAKYIEDITQDELFLSKNLYHKILYHRESPINWIRTKYQRKNLSLEQTPHFF